MQEIEEGFLYRKEWPEYEKKLHGKFIMRSAFSREPPYKPDGGKAYVPDLMWEDKAVLGEAILTGKAYMYVCGDGKSVNKSVKDVSKFLGEAKGGSAEKEGAGELKLLKERSRYLTGDLYIFSALEITRSLDRVLRNVFVSWRLSSGDQRYMVVVSSMFEVQQEVGTDTIDPSRGDLVVMADSYLRTTHVIWMELGYSLGLDEME